MLIDDHAAALACLERIGYSRLRGYWHPFREPRGGADLDGADNALDRVNVNFVLGATFQNSVELHVFDKRLRLMAMDALERIEIALRADIIHALGKLDPWAYMKPELFDKRFVDATKSKSGLSRHDDWMQRHEQLILRSRDDLIQYHKGKYGLPLPLWAAAEIWDFGTLSTLFGGMRSAEQDAIASKYGVSNGRVLASWLRSLNYLRNVCAHHSRLWNLNIVDQPKLPSSRELPWVEPFVANNLARARCYLLLCITRHLLAVVNPRSTWPARMKEHLECFPALAHLGLSVARMGAHEGWQSDWQ